LTDFGVANVATSSRKQPVAAEAFGNLAVVFKSFRSTYSEISDFQSAFAADTVLLSQFLASIGAVLWNCQRTLITSGHLQELMAYTSGR